LIETVTSVKRAKNLVVVKTHSGMAEAAAAAFDAIGFSDCMGCIAGDDTMLLIFDEDEKAESIIKELKKITSV